MKTYPRRLISILTFAVPTVWSLNSSAQTPPSGGVNQPPSSTVSREGIPDLSTKYQYTLELMRYGIEVRYAEYSIPKGAATSGFISSWYFGSGFKDVWSGIALTLDVGIIPRTSTYQKSKQPEIYFDYWVDGYWIKASVPFRPFSKIPFLYIQPSYTFQKAWIYPGYLPYGQGPEVSKKNKINPHRICIGPSFQWDKSYMALHVSSELALSIGPGVNEFSIIILNATLVLQPIWF